MLGALACNRTGKNIGPGEFRAMVVDDPESFWKAPDFVQMVPPAHLPSSSADIDQVEIWLSLPEGGRIEVVDDGNPDRSPPHLRFPPGTRADRVEFAQVGERRLIVDVRGTIVEAGGKQRFHTLRRDGFGPDSKLFGVEWNRNDAAGHAAAMAHLFKEVRATRQAKAMDETRREAFLRDLAGKNDCLRCHGLSTPSAERAEPGRIVLRGTDASGFYTPATVLRDGVALEPYGAFDRNHKDPFTASVRCDSGQATWTPRRKGGPARATCPDGSVPQAIRDVTAGLAADDSHTQALCRSRQVLLGAMTPEAKDRLGVVPCG